MMKTERFIIFLMFFAIGNLHKNQLKHILEAENNFFHKINLNTHKISNILFKTLKLDKNLNKRSNVQLLLKMHSDMNKMAERNYAFYEKMKKIATFNETDNNNIEEIFVDIVREEIDKLKHHNSENKNSMFEYKTTNDSADNKEDSIETNNNFWLTVDKLATENLLDHIVNKTETAENQTTSEEISSGDLELWGMTKAPNEERYSDFYTNDTRRIYKGKKTKIKNYPFLVSVHVMGKFICAGSVISKDLVLTAASCLRAADKQSRIQPGGPIPISVRVGSDHADRSGEVIPIAKVIYHQKYDPTTLRNNLAIIRMSKKLKLSKKKVQRIMYDNKNSITENFEEVTILGWGAKDENHKSDETQKVSVGHLDIYNVNDCKDVYSRVYVGETNFCAGFVSKGSGACNGDVGGPAVKSGLLVGVISFGPTICGTPDAPTVFTKVSHYTSWIESIIQSKTIIQKPIMRNKKVKTLKPLWRRPPVLMSMYGVTSPKTPPSTALTTKRNKFPEEIIVLKKIIQEIILSNSSVLDYLLTGDIFYDDEIQKTPSTASLVKTNKIFQRDRGRMLNRMPKRFSVKSQQKSLIKGLNNNVMSWNSYNGNIPKYNPPSLNSIKTKTIDDTQWIERYKEFFNAQANKQKTSLKNKFSDVSSSDERDEASSYYEEEISIEVTTKSTKYNSTSRGAEFFKFKAREPEEKMFDLKYYSVEDESFDVSNKTYRRTETGNNRKEASATPRNYTGSTNNNKSEITNGANLDITEISKVFEETSITTIIKKLNESNGDNTYKERLTKDTTPAVLSEEVEDFDNFMDDKYNLTQFKPKYIYSNNTILRI